MIKVSRLNGKTFVLNALYIETVESFPDTTITLTNGKKYVVKESEDRVMQSILEFYQSVNLLGQQLAEEMKMKNNKLLMIMLMMLVAITLIGAIALVLVMKFSGDNETKEPTIDEVLEASVDIPQVTANLASDDYIRISFKIQTENKKAKEELQKEIFRLKTSSFRNCPK